ncbi:MAG: hypothetical protein ACREON_10755, partial [Gemmatimonadaceae bacterium]
PVDSQAARRLIAALAAAGDRAGALQQARVHEVLLREQLDLSPDPAIVALVARLRDGDGQAAVLVPERATAAADPPAPAALAVPNESPSSLSEGAHDGHSSGRDAGRGGRGRSERAGARWWTFSRSAAPAGFVVLVGALALTVGRSRRGEPASEVPVVPHTIMVAPFRVSGADGSLRYLREGMMDLLATRLADDNAARAADPGSVMSAWREAGLLPGAEATREDALGVARALGAEELVAGSVVGTPRRIVMTAALLGTLGGEVRAQATVEGPADSLTTLVDRLASRLLAIEAGEGERLTAHTTPSLSALRSYLDGQAAYRRGSYEEAVRGYERALRRDSTFALAALGLALAADRLNGAEPHERGLALAWASRDKLTERDRAHVVAFAGPRYPAPSSAAEHLAAWEQAVALAPDRADVWHELGERYYYDGAVLGAASAESRAAAAFRRAYELDPSFTPALRLLLHLAARMGDTATLRLLAVPAVLQDTTDAAAAFLRWRVAVARDDENGLRWIRARMPSMSAASLRAIAMTSQFDGVELEDAERALRLRRARLTRGGDQLDLLLAEHSLALNEGRPTLALEITERLAEAHPGSRAHLRLRVLDALYSDGIESAAAEAAVELARTADAAPAEAPVERALQLADVCVLAQWRLARGDRDGVSRAIEALRATEGVGEAPRMSVPVGAAPIACAELLDAWLAVATRRRRAKDRVEQLDSLMLSGAAAGDASRYAHLVTARLYERLGERRSALAAIRRRPYMKGWPRYRSTEWLDEGKLALAAKDWAGAERAYVQYLVLRFSPEAELVPAVEQVRAALERAADRRR